MIRDHKLQRAELFKLKSKSSSAIAKNVERDSYSCVYMRISPIFLAHRSFSPSSSLFDDGDEELSCPLNLTNCIVGLRRPYF